jgi:hypothetical protein
MKSAKEGPYTNVAEPLNRTNKRCILGQSEMRSDTVVVVGIGPKNSAQVALTKDDDVIKAFSTDRADQSLRTPVLPG